MLVKFEQNRMVQTTQNFELFDKKLGFYNHFWQRVDAILEDVLAQIIVQCSTINLKIIIFQYSKNYGTLTLVTRLKIAPNMADPISLNVNLP